MFSASVPVTTRIYCMSHNDVHIIVRKLLLPGTYNVNVDWFAVCQAMHVQCMALISNGNSEHVAHA